MFVCEEGVDFMGCDVGVEGGARKAVVVVVS